MRLLVTNTIVTAVLQVDLVPPSGKIAEDQSFRTGAGLAVAVGEVTISFSISGLPQAEVQEIAGTWPS